jgi:hypothetical protein
MTPKEKAIELIQKYNDLMECGIWNGTPISIKLNKGMAQQCALIAVDEIIITCAFNDYKTKKYFEHCSDYNDTYFVTYWQEVRRYIEKL